ncbi:TadE family type IV pilus minor pilin [Micromonospora auratinigra]|uniref:TadE family type IV pilus minor pilin n=1 Tax=Micromonospora auratinigra TaxID=261654 RepID=UPI0038B3B71F
MGTASRQTSADAGRSGPRARAAGRVSARGRGERGSFTAELAAGLPALVLLLLAGLTAVEAVTTRAGCLDAAREAALAAARGESGSVAGAGHAPTGATVSVTVSGDRVVATVRAPVRSLGARLPRIEVTATAVAAVEPGTPGPRP